jgi:hypothetical protein
MKFQIWLRVCGIEAARRLVEKEYPRAMLQRADDL